MKNKSFAITAEIVVPDGGSQRHDRFPGRSLRRLVALCHRREAGVLLQLVRPAAVQGLRRRADPAGDHQVRVEFAYDGGGLGKGGDVKLYVDGDQVGEGRVDATVPMVFSADETTDVGTDTATPVTDDLAPRMSASPVG